MEAGGGKIAVLVSHNIMTAVDDSLPASLSPAVHDLLRTELGFDGVVMTDDLAMDAVAAYAQDGAVAVRPSRRATISSSPPTTAPRFPRYSRRWRTAPSPWTPSTPPARRVLTWKQSLGLL